MTRSPALATPASNSFLDCLNFREVTDANWSDFEKLFESRGGPKSCWCMVWRATPAEAKHPDGASRKSALQQRIHTGTTIGILGYLDNEPVAWCSIAPRSSYRRLVTITETNAPEEYIWSLACFFVIRRLRGHGITQHLIAAAVKFAQSRGATIIEAYPVDHDSPSYRFMGFVPTFELAGFHEIGRAGNRRHVFRLDLKEAAEH